MLSSIVFGGKGRLAAEYVAGLPGLVFRVRCYIFSLVWPAFVQHVWRGRCFAPVKQVAGSPMLNTGGTAAWQVLSRMSPVVPAVKSEVLLSIETVSAVTMWVNDILVFAPMGPSVTPFYTTCAFSRSFDLA